MRFQNYLQEGIEDKGLFKAIFLGGVPGAGKMQPYDADVITPFGIKKMGDLKLGEQISNPNGGISSVIAIWEHGEKDVYRVDFIDGTSCEVGLEHLWLAWKSSGTTKRNIDDRQEDEKDLYPNFAKIYNTEMLLKNPDDFIIPLTKQVQFTKNHKLLIHPYVLGALLGDGGITQQVMFHNIDEECIVNMKSLVEEYHNDTLNIREKDHSITGGNIRKLLKHYDLFGLKSENKFIPETYKYASIDNRYLLVQGLMDTDGYCDKKGGCYYTSVSKQLTDDMMFVLRSLGYKVSVTPKVPTYKDKDGNKKEGQLAYTLYIQGRDKDKLFNLSRKKELVKDFNGGVSVPGKRIQNIRYVGKKQCRCITIDNPNGLYLTNDFIVTHNTYTSKLIFPGDIQPRIVSIDYYYEAGNTPHKSKSLVQKQLASWINSMLPLIIDGTSSKPEVILRRQGTLESFGYETGIVYINTDVDLAIQRMKQRKRTVPIKLIQDVDASLKEIKGYLKGKFEFSMEIDNNEGELNNEVILDAYRKSSKFFNSPLKNEIGIKNLNKLKEMKEKYLNSVYSMDRIKQITKSWYGVD